MKISFPIAFIITTLACLGIQYSLFLQFNVDWTKWHWGLFLYFPLLTLIIQNVLSKKAKGRPQAFVTVFMGSMAAKLFISLILLLIVIYQMPAIKISFAISFLSLYLIYTILNTVYIFSQLKKQ